MDARLGATLNRCPDAPPTLSALDVFQMGRGHRDALKAMGRAMLASGQLGQHQGLPATIIVSSTLKELESAAGRRSPAAAPCCR